LLPAHITRDDECGQVSGRATRDKDSTSARGHAGKIRNHPECLIFSSDGSRGFHHGHAL